MLYPLILFVFVWLATTCESSPWINWWMEVRCVSFVPWKVQIVIRCDVVCSDVCVCVPSCAFLRLPSCSWMKWKGNGQIPAVPALRILSMLLFPAHSTCTPKSFWTNIVMFHHSFSLYDEESPRVFLFLLFLFFEIERCRSPGPCRQWWWRARLIFRQRWRWWEWWWWWCRCWSRCWCWICVCCCI